MMEIISIGMMQVDEVLDKTADVLMVDGWRQGEYGTANGPKCSSGGIRYVVYGEDMGEARPCEPEDVQLLIDSMVQLQHAIRTEPLYKDVAKDGTAVVPWNDHPDQTADNVIDTFRKAAKMYREDNQKEK